MLVMVIKYMEIIEEVGDKKVIMTMEQADVVVELVELVEGLMVVIVVVVVGGRHTQ